MYPKLVIDLKKLQGNLDAVAEITKDRGGCSLMIVTKGLCADPEMAGLVARDPKVDYMADSRVKNLASYADMARANGKKTVLLRIPMHDEVEGVIQYADISFNSELSTIRLLNEEAGRVGKVHDIVLMIDLGDLREGYWDKNEMTDVAEQVETGMEHLELAGVGTNLGCYGSILATKEKLDELVDVAERIEARIGRKLRYISGGATSSLMRVLDGDIPERINMLRCGEGILLARDLELFYGYDMSFMHQDVYTLKAEVIEVKEKPTHPVGQIAVDAFGHTPDYVDRGIRKRALLGIGKVDYGSIEDIFPREKGIQVIGASSDHTILDVEDCGRDLKPGDIIDFDINYASLVYVTNCRNVQIIYV